MAIIRSVPNIVRVIAKGQAGANGSNAAPIMTTRAALAAATVGVSAAFYIVLGYAAAGDCGDPMLYIKRASEPSHAGKVQSADGYWFELASDYSRPEYFGSKGDLSTNDRAALNDADGYAYAKSIPLKVRAGHALASSLTFTAKVDFEGAGRLKPGASVRVAFSDRFTLNPHSYVFDLAASGSGIDFDASLVSDGYSAKAGTERLTPMNFGAIGDNSTPCDAAATRCVYYCQKGGIEFFWPRGMFKFAAPFVVDLATALDRGFTMRGAGMERTILSMVGFTPDAGDPYYAMWVKVSGGTAGVQASAYCVHPKFCDFMVYSQFNGCGIRWGRQDYTDALNELIVEQVGSRNFFGTLSGHTSTVAMEWNFVLNARIWCIANTGTHDAGYVSFTAYGTAMRYRQISFSEVHGSHGSANIAHHFTGGFNNSTSIYNSDCENTNYCVWSDVSTVVSISFIGGTFNYYVKGVVDAGGSDNLLLNPSLNPSFVSTSDWYSTARTTSSGWTTRCADVTIIPFTDPVVGATGVTKYNNRGRDLMMMIYTTSSTCTVAFWTGGTITIPASSVFSFPLTNSQPFTLTYAAAIGYAFLPIA